MVAGWDLVPGPRGLVSGVPGVSTTRGWPAGGGGLEPLQDQYEQAPTPRSCAVSRPSQDQNWGHTRISS